VTDPAGPTYAAQAAPPDKRAAPLRRHLERGGSVRLAANGDVERRLPSGQVAGRYGRDVLELALAEGWLVEARRRETPLGDVVEYVATAAPAAESKPETKRRPAKPRRVKRTTRAKSPTPSASGAPASGPRRKRSRPKDRLVGGRLRKTDLPTEPAPLPDGTECVPRDEARERLGCSAKALAQALHKGHVDPGGPFIPAGAMGGPRSSVALTEKTLAYARRTWGGGPDAAPGAEPEPLEDGTECLTRPEAADRLGTTPERLNGAVFRGKVDLGPAYVVGGRTVASVALTARTLAYAEAVWVRGERPSRWAERTPPPPPWLGRAVELEAGAVLLQGRLLEALGFHQSSTNRAARAVAALRTPGDGSAWLYRVDDELVAALEELGFVVTLTPPASAEEPTEAERPAPSGDGHWSSLLPAAPAPVDTPLFT